MEKLKVLDLFSGIGMLSYGLDKTGLYETTAFCEWDKSCRDVLHKNYPKIPVFEGVSHLDGYQFKGSIDVIVGGFPCQDLSNANPNGKGFEGEAQVQRGH